MTMGMRVEGAKSGAAAAAWQGKAATTTAAPSAPAPAAAAATAQNTASKQIQADMQSLSTGSSFSIHA
jgi:hypothetical protein